MGAEHLVESLEQLEEDLVELDDTVRYAPPLFRREVAEKAAKLRSSLYWALIEARDLAMLDEDAGEETPPPATLADPEVQEVA